jgi:putative ABC transport system permease protein
MRSRADEQPWNRRIEMSVLRQIVAVTAMGLRSVPHRKASSSVVVIGIAGVVGVIVSVFGMTRSMSEALVGAGRDERAIVLRAGATSEFSSTLLVDAVATIKDAPGIARASNGRAAASAEFVTAINLLRKEDGNRAGVSIRGIEPEAAAVRPEIEIVEGRTFTPGLRELIAGRGAASEFRGLAIGDEVGLRDGRWKVVGVFTSGRNVNESTLMTDAATLLSAYQRTASNSVTVRLASVADFDQFKAALTTNPTLSVSVDRESDYYRREGEESGEIFGLVTTVVGGIMALGALFAALNTMYSAVSSRARDIATLRAIGFGASGVVVSVLIESLLLALVGALLGAGVSWLLFSGDVVTLGDGVSSLVFEMRVTPALLGLGVLWAVTVGFVGGLFPALRAARLPVATALRAI